MASVKVRVGDEFRRFTVPATATWADVAAKIRELLNAATLDGYSVTYVDAEGDTVAIGTDSELRELLARPTPLRLTVTERRPASPAASSSHESFVDVAAESRPDVMVEDTDDESDRPAAAPTSAHDAGSAGPAPAPDAAEDKRAAPEDPLEALLGQFHGLVATALERNGDLIEQGRRLFGDIAAEVQQQAEAAHREYAERQRAAYEERCRAWEERVRAWQSRRAALGKERAAEDEDEGDSATPTFRCGAGRCGSRFAHWGGFYAPFQRDLAQLHALGFTDDGLNAELLQAFHGDLAAVVQALTAF